MATGSRHILLTCLSSPPLPHPDIPGSSPETLPLSTKRFERFVCAGCETATEPGRVTDPVSEDVCFELLPAPRVWESLQNSHIFCWLLDNLEMQPVGNACMANTCQTEYG